MGTGSRGREGWGHIPAAPGHAYQLASSPVRRAGDSRRWGRAGTRLPELPGSLGRGLFQVTVVLGASQDIIPQLKKKYDVDTLDMVFIDHWKDRYLPDTLLLEVSPVRAGWVRPCGGWPGSHGLACVQSGHRGEWGPGPGRAGGPRGAPWMACICREQQIPPLEVEVLASQSCLTLCDPMDCTCQAPLSGILQGDLPDRGIKPGFPAVRLDSLPSEPPGKPCCPWQVGA